MKKFNFFMALLLALIIILSGCTRQPSDRAAGSNEGRVLNLSTLAPLTTVDPHGTVNIRDLEVLRQVYESLYRQNEATGEHMPHIASSYNVSADGRIYTFTIRQGVKFHNGDALTARDVEFSFRRAMNSPRVRSYVAGISNVETEGDHTFIVTLEQPNAAFMTNLGFIFIINERETLEHGEEFGTRLTLAGSGPFYFTHLVHDIEWELAAFSDYYRGEAAIKRIHYRPITDPAAGLIAFESGALDWYVAPIANWAALIANPRYNTEIVQQNHISYAVINHLNGPLGDDNLRKAIAYAIDKEAMNLASFDGLAVEADFMVDPQRNAGAPSTGIIYDYNLARAREYLARSAFPNGTHLGTINCSAGGYFESMAQVLQDNLAAIGLTTTIQRLESATNLNMSRNQQFDLLVTGFAPNGDFDSWKMYCHTGFRGTFYNVYEGDKFDYRRMDALWEAGVATTDLSERERIYRELNDMIADTATQIPVFHRISPVVWVTDLHVPINYPNYAVVYEWSWR